MTAPQMRGTRYFFSKREGSQNQPVIYWREGYKGADKVLIDPAEARSDGPDDGRVGLAVQQRPTRSPTAPIAPATRTRPCTC